MIVRPSSWLLAERFLISGSWGSSMDSLLQLRVVRPSVTEGDWRGKYEKD